MKKIGRMIYIYRERERELDRQTDMQTDRQTADTDIGIHEK